MELNSITMLIQFSLSFLLLFVAMPSLVIRFDSGDDSLFDKLFIPLIHSTLFVIATVHVLVLLRLFETLTILAVCIAGLLYFWRRRFKKDYRGYQTRLMTGLFDEMESEKSLKQRLQHVWIVLRQTVRSWKEPILQLLVGNPLASVLILSTVGYAAYVRFHHALSHYYFGASDPYYHLEWTKFVMKNKFFVGGVYSYGFESVMAAMARFYNLDLYNVVRFIGPAAGVLLVLSVGYAVRKMGSNLYGVFLAMFLYSVLGILPAYTWRQLSALPMEYAAVFFLPGVAFWALFCRYGSRKHLLLAAECFLLTLLLHPFATVCLAAAFAGIWLWYIGKLWRRKDLARSILSIGFAGLLGVLPLGIGLASGIPFYSDSLGYIKNNIKAGGNRKDWVHQIAVWFTPQTLMVCAVIGFISIVCITLYGYRRKVLQKREIGLPPFLLLTAVFFIIYKSDVFGLPTVIPLDRFGVFFAPFVAAVGGLAVLAVGRIADHGLKRTYISGVLSVMIAVSILFSNNAVYSKNINREWPPVGLQYQYDQAIQSYLNIRDHFEAGDWTIISPVEEYSLVEAFGYHENLWRFIRNIEPDSSEFAGFPTSNVFFFLETVPLHPEAPYKVYKPIQPSDSLKPFPVPGPGDNYTDFYYRSPNRIILEAKLKSWIEWFRKTNPGKMTLYVDTPFFKVYYLKQTAQLPPVQLPKLSRKYEGEW